MRQGIRLGMGLVMGLGIRLSLGIEMGFKIGMWPKIGTGDGNANVQLMPSPIPCYYHPQSNAQSPAQTHA